MGDFVKMPKLGMDMDQGTVVEWFVDEGDAVESGQVVAEIESEKTTGEVNVRRDGVLHQHLLAVGESVEPGGNIAIVGDADEDVSDMLADADTDGSAAEAETAAADDASGADEAAPEATPADTQSTASQSSTGSETAASAADVKATPRAKKLAEERGVDLTGVEGTGPQGAVSESDVEAAAADVEAAATDDGATTAASAADVKATPRAKKLAEERGVDLTGIEGTGPQGAVAESDVEAAAAEVEAAADASAEEAQPATEPGATESDTHVFAPPRVRRLARQLGVDLSTVARGDTGGPITEADVEAAAAGEVGEETREPEAVGTHDEERPLSGMRRTIANRLGQSYREAVHVTEHRTALAAELLDAAAAADEGLDAKVTVNDVLILAVSATLDEHPAFNATFEDDVHRLHETQNICVAVDIDAGLVAPVVRNVGELPLAELAAKRRSVTERALAGEHTMDDLTGGTFTISNLGMLGVESFDPVINPPQVAILGVNAIRDAVVPTDDGVGVRKQISFDLSFDHRIVDGADAARFLQSLVGHVENPWPLVVAAGGR